MKKQKIFSITILLIFVINLLPGLSVYAASPAVTTGSAVINTFGYGTFEFTLTANGGYNVTDCGIKYGTSSSNLNKTASNGYVGANKDTFSVEVSGLSLGTVYYYQAYAVNENNESAVGAVKSVVIPGSFSITSPSNGASFSYGSDVTVKWSAAKNAKQYRLVMRDITAGESSSSDIYIGTSTSYTIDADDLVGGHEYKIHVQARSVSGSDDNAIWASNGDEYYFSTKLNTPKITTPSNNGTMTLSSPVIKWNSVPDVSMYALLLKDNVTDNNLLGGSGYFLSSGETSCNLANITWDDFSTDKLTANRAYTITLRAYGEEGYYTESSSVVFTLKSDSVPTVRNYDVDNITALSFEITGNIITTSDVLLSDITDCGFYYREYGSSSKKKVSLGKPTSNLFYTTISGLSANTDYQVMSYATNANGEGTGSWTTVTTSEKIEEPETYTLSVSPTTGKAKKVYTFSMDVDTLPDNAYLQFDNPQTGDWFDESYAASAWAFNWQDYVVKPGGGFTLTKDLNIGTPGNVDNNYARKARVIYYYNGIAKTTEPIEFIVKPNDEEVPVITVDDISYAINGKNLTITVLTSSSVEKLKLKNNATTIGVFDSEYTTQSSGKRLWTITKPLDYYANKSLTFTPGNNEYGYSDSEYDLFISYDAPSSMGTLEIMSPQSNAQHQENQTLSVSWSAPVTKPDNYTLTVSHNDNVVFTKDIEANATTTVVPGEYFVYSGTYSISLTAKKENYSNLYEVTNINIEPDEYIPEEPINGVNPSVKEICDYVYNYVMNIELGRNCPDAYRAICAMINTENPSFRQFDSNGNVVTNKNSNGTIDYGLCQLNSQSFEPGGFLANEDIERAKTDWQYNVSLGIKKYGALYYAFTNEKLYLDRLNEMMSDGASKNEAMAKSTYSMYNGGSDDWKRWQDTPETADNNYAKYYKEKRWEKETGIYIDEEKTTQISKPGVIKIAMDVPVEVRSSADSSSNIMGRFGNGTTVTVLSSKNDYLQVEGKDYETSKTITGYVKAAYVSYDIAPVKKDSSFIGTVNKTSINIGEEVTFTVNATYGSYDFRISFDDSYEQSVEMNYFDGVYNYARPINGVGPRIASMSWYDPSVKSRVSVDFPTVNVWINAYGWNSAFSGNTLYVEQVAETNTIKHGNNDISYGLYVKNSNGAYCYGKGVADTNNAINKNGKYALYREWNVSKELRLAPGTYEYGIVAISGKNCIYSQLSTFTLEQYNAETERRYVGVFSGSKVYEEKPDGSLKENPYIELPYGQKVEYICGTEGGQYNGYVQVMFPWTDGNGNTYTYTMWISNRALVPYNPLGLELTYTPSEPYKNSDFYDAITNVCLTGDYRRDIVNVAGSQEGYREGSCLNDLSGWNDGTHSYNNYTEYNYWWVNNVSEKNNKGETDDGAFVSMYWCASFVSWCARQANIPLDIIPNYKSCGAFKNDVKNNGIGTFYSGKDRKPKPGDLFFTDTYSHTGIVVDINPDDENKFISYEGNAKSGEKSNNGIGVVMRKDRIIKNYYFFEPNYDSIKKIENNTQINLFSLSDETTDTISYYISCYDIDGDNFKTLRGTNDGTITLEAPEKIDSINVRIPIDESQQLVTLYHAGQGFENGNKFTFTTNTISFTAIVKDLVGEGEYEFDFEIHRDVHEETTVNYSTVSYYNIKNEFIGEDIVDFNSPEIGNAPFTTAYVEFNNVDNETLTIEVSTGSYYEENVWSPISHKFDYIDEEQQFVLNVNTGTNIQTVEYTIVRSEKSNDTSLQSIYVNAYNESEECFASNIYVVEDDIISINLPYSTKYFDFDIEASSLFTTAEVYINSSVVSNDELIDVSNIQSAFVNVVAEDGSVKKYELQITVARTADTTSPVITVIGESGTNYTSGSKITEMITYTATDESWCETYLYFEGGILDELESVSECGSYTVIAVDVFGNKSEFSFVYDDGTLPLTKTTFKNTETYHKFYVAFEEDIDSATIYAAIYNSNGEMIDVVSAPCDGDDYYIVNVPVNANTKKAKIFVWTTPAKPLGTAEILNME